MIESQKDTEERKCEYCGKDYTAKRYWAKYCSRNCKMKAFYKSQILKDRQGNSGKNSCQNRSTGVE